tara:strand:+ start:6475 stop:7032 length:558 start_codon:yes stop_codon:yes gene_type:complete
MAIIVEQHVVADRYVPASAITAGHLVTQNAAGQAVSAVAGSTDAIGVAGDSWLAAEGQTTAYSDQVTIGSTDSSTPRQRWTENRVSDFYDETRASGLITVYHGGGKFWILNTLFDSDATDVVPGDKLQVTAAGTAGEWGRGAGDVAGEIVGMAVGASQAYQSGVPGTDIQGSITLGNFVPVTLRI